MCLVSLVVLKNKIILTSNRDEAPYRAAKEIREEIINDKKVIFPADEAGGSWIFCSDRGDIICLLNGAFERHKRKLPYRMSRGLVMKSFFEYDHPVDFLQHFDFVNIEPFTMIIVSQGKKIEFRWDGQIKYVKELYDKKEYLWSSSTLYDDRDIRKREQWYKEERAKYDELQESTIEEIHRNGGTEDKEQGFIMNRRDLVKTISITQIILDTSHVTLKHQDLLSNEVYNKSYRLKSH